MKVIPFFLFSMLLAQAAIAEQRVLELRPGSACDKISETEKRLGSHATTPYDPMGASKYSGTQRGAKATIKYICDKGRLSEQLIVVTRDNREAAYSFAKAQKAELIKHLGDPLHDGLNLSSWERFFLGFKGGDLEYLSSVVVWGREKEDTMLSVKQTGPDLWEVSISQGSSKWEYMNNS